MKEYDFVHTHRTGANQEGAPSSLLDGKDSSAGSNLERPYFKEVLKLFPTNGMRDICHIKRKIKPSCITGVCMKNPQDQLTK